MDDDYAPIDEGAAASQAAKRKIMLMILITLLIVATIAAVVFAGLFFLDLVNCDCPNVTDDDAEPSDDNDPKKPWTIDDLNNTDLQPVYFQAQWLINADSWVSPQVGQDGNTTLMIYTVSDGKLDDPTVFLSADKYIQTSDFYIISPTGKYVLFGSNQRQLYRHSYYATYDVVSVETGERIPLTNTFPDDVRLAQWSPDGLSIAFVTHNNLYVTNIETEKEYQVTNDGKTNSIINGAPDWLYEEEILESNSALWWNPTSSYIAFMRFDETNVPQYTFPLYNTNAQYPTNYEYKYPLPGEQNSIASLWLFDVKEQEVHPVDIQSDDDFYIPGVQWRDETSVAFRKLNRLQTIEELHIAETPTGASTLLLTTQSTLGWLEPTTNLHFLSNGQFVRSVVDNDRFHIALFSPTGDQERVLTTGDYDVTQLLAITDDVFYFIAAAPTPAERHLFRGEIAGGDPVQITPTGAPGYNSASFSPSTLYYFWYQMGPSIPQTSLMQSPTTQQQQPTQIKLLEANTNVAEEVNKYRMPTREFFTFNSADNTATLPAFILKPPNFNNTKQYPVLLYFYGGPNSQQVTQAWSVAHQTYHYSLVTNEDVLVVFADNRGTCCLGNAFLKSTYKQLGVVETQDQVAIAKQIAALPYVDEHKVACWGWSYGGFMAGRVVSDEQPSVSLSVSVAPVTSWLFYDTAYTERYMQTPTTNSDGYNVTSVIGRAANVAGRDYFVIHGTGDDNVHFANSADWVTDLVTNGIQLDTFYYPDKAHSISGVVYRTHLYTMMTNFIDNKWNIRTKTNGNKRKQTKRSLYTKQQQQQQQQQPRVYHWSNSRGGSTRAQREGRDATL